MAMPERGGVHEQRSCLRWLFSGEGLSADLIVVVPFGIVVVIILIVVIVFIHPDAHALWS